MKLLSGQLEARKRLVERLLERYRRFMGLDFWDLTVDWDEKAARASTEVIPTCKEASISFNIKHLQKITRLAELEFLVVHELSHCLTWHFAAHSKFKGAALRYLDEDLTTTIARSVINAYRGGIRDALDDEAPR